MKISKDTPLAEITLRKYEPAHNEMSLYEISRRLMLSLGLLQPGDSRDVIVDVFLAVIMNKGLNATEIEAEAGRIRTNRGSDTKGLTAPNVRRQILRLKNMFLIHKHEGVYISREEENFLGIWNEHIKNYYLSGILNRITDTIKILDEIKRKNV